jgi:Ca2+-binding EF-hand superfamily protein
MDQTKLFTEERIKSVFRMIDKDNNGFVEREELQAVLESTFWAI